METTQLEVVEAAGKRDTRGRRIMSGQQREEVLARYDGSGLTQKAFAKREGLNVHTFVSWLAQRRAAGGPSGGGAPGAEPAMSFARVQLAMSHAGAALFEVVLRDGRVARGPEAEPLARLVRALED